MWTTVVPVLATAFITFLLTRWREHESEWRKLKFGLYQEYLNALSGIVEGREVTPEAHARYADAINAMSLAASGKVLRALRDYQDYTSGKTLPQNINEHDRFFNALIRAMRADMFARSAADIENFQFRLISPPKPHPKG